METSLHPSLVPSRYQVFSEAYRKGLAAAVAEKPTDYMVGTMITYSAEKRRNVIVSVEETPEQYAERVAVKILASIAAHPDSVSYVGGGFTKACRALGIRPTRTEILAFLRGRSNG